MSEEEFEKFVTLRLATFEFPPRRCKVARLIVEGFTNKKIAALLSIKVSTVEKHVGCILEDTNVTNRFGFIALILSGM